MPRSTMAPGLDDLFRVSDERPALRSHRQMGVNDAKNRLWEETLCRGVDLHKLKKE